jgi:hypothetical protein
MTLCYTAFSLPIVVWLMRDFFEAAADRGRRGGDGRRRAELRIFLRALWCRWR